MFIDSHCHLDFPDFIDDFSGVIERAKIAGVAAMLTIGVSLAKAGQVIKIAETHNNIWASVGIHPHETGSADYASASAVLEQLIQLSNHPKVVAIGETGLDYYYDSSPRLQQITLFKTHIAAARRSNLPLIIHTRMADEEMTSILTEEMAKGKFTGVLHCFTSSQALADIAIKLGFYISMSGIITFKNAADLRDICLTIPSDRLLIETDAPYLAPVPQRGKRNEPAFVAHTAKFIAELRGVELNILAQQTSRNFKTLFKKADFTAANILC